MTSTNIYDEMVTLGLQGALDMIKICTSLEQAQKVITEWIEERKGDVQGVQADN